MRKIGPGDLRGSRWWRIGVDVGGTWVRVVASDAAGRRRSARAASPGLAGLPAFLGTLWTRWRIAPGDVARLVVASRGVWTARERRRQQRRLRGLARTVRVIADAEAAHRAAFGDAPGVLLLAGTGSMALGRDGRGRWARAGGLGPLLGDDGSAFWIGREWLRGSGRAEDFAAARRLIASGDPVAGIAGLAPGVLRRARAGSPRARAIVRAGQRALAELVAATARRLGAPRPVPVSWGGRLLDAADYRAGVWRAARRLGLEIRPMAARESAAEAALRLAGAAGRTSAGRPALDGAGRRSRSRR
jgi:N-acetylglucosamine kinase-like BadF-type ATPase